MIQKPLVLFFNGIQSILKSLSEKHRNTVLFLLCFSMVFCMFFINHRTFDHNVGTTMIFGSMAIIAVTLFSVTDKVRGIEWDPFVIFPLVLFGIGTIVIGMIHPIGDGYLVLAVDSIIVYPALYFVWINRGDHESLYKMVAVSTVMAGIVSYILCFRLAIKGILAVYNDGSISGHTKNPNVLGMIGALVLISSIYLYYELKQNYKTLVFTSIGVGVSLSYAILTHARAAILSEIICIAAAVIFVIKKGSRNSRKINHKKLLVFILIVGTLIVGGLQLQRISRASILRQHPELVQEILEIDQQVAETAEAESNENATGKDVSDSEEGSFEESIDTFSAGRITIWKIYSQRFNLLGNKIGDIRDQFPPKAEYRAHNNIVDYIFRCGYIVGGFYVFYYIATGICGLIILFSKKYTEPKHLFVIMMIGVYSLYAMVEISNMPFCRVVPCFYFLTMAPIAGKLRNFQNKDLKADKAESEVI